MGGEGGGGSVSGGRGRGERQRGEWKEATHARKKDPFHRLAVFEGAGDVRDLPRAAVGPCGGQRVSVRGQLPCG